jgi:Flp pilus assembly CpaE family ATPase
MTQAPEKSPLPDRLAAQSAQIQVRFLAFVYVAIAVGAAALAFYLHTAMGHRLMSPQVLFPSLGAVWFAFRAFYKFTGRG